MKVEIKAILLENFKGVKSATINFGRKDTEITGSNGAGKTTIATALYWLFADKDRDLHSNPPIRPIGVEECTPRVEVVMDIDGVEVSAAKIQKQTVKKSKTGGADTVSLSNSYEVNSVEYGERDFKKKMSEYGFDFDLFLPLSHTEVFTGQKMQDMRKVLFGMVSEKSDKEIAATVDGAKEAAELLQNYTVDEVKAMQNATLRKIKEVYGKDGEILRAKIEGMEQTKVDIDVAELELQKADLVRQLEESKAKSSDAAKQYEEFEKLSDGILELQFELNGLQLKANQGLTEQKNQLRNTEYEISNKIKNLKYAIERSNSAVTEAERDVALYENRLAEIRKEWTGRNNAVFDENTLVCAYCGQEYPEEKKEKIRADFETTKATFLEECTRRGNLVKKQLDEAKAIIEDTDASNLVNELEQAEKELLKIIDERASLPESVDISETEDYKRIKKQIEEKENALKQGENAQKLKKILKTEQDLLQTKIVEVEKKIALAQRNVEIDEQISELQKKQSEYEQSKADAEKVLYQLQIISQRKNELLTEEVNKHFDLVKWQLFEFQKNGEVKDDCTPLIDGKRFGESTNTGREVLAKLDIINGLQRFYGQNYPVFLDGAECLSDETKNRINMDCQMIYLCVTEDDCLKIKEIAK